jgi:hypothetical protein
VSVSAINPDQYNCIGFASVVSESVPSGPQIQAAKGRCGIHATIDNTCSQTNNFVFFVERTPAGGGNPVCYPHGAATLGNSDLLTVDSSAGNGVWYTYINGTLREGQSGYTSNVHIDEWGEYTGVTCPGWSATATFSGWQRYNYPNNAWTTVQSSSTGNGGCWSIGTVSNGNFSVGH